MSVEGYMFGGRPIQLNKRYPADWKGGPSFLGSQYALSANDVVNYEVMLANGDIVDANSEENKDLWMALKGGGNNFGFVTAYKIGTHAQTLQGLVRIDTTRSGPGTMCSRV